MGSIQERVAKNGKKSYRCQIRMKGVKPLYQTFTRKTDAKRWIQETETAIRKGKFFDYVESKKHTFSELVERYKEDTFHQRKSIDGPSQTLSWWCERIGHLTLDQITTILIRKHWDFLAQSGSEKTGKPFKDRTLNSYLETISTMFSMAIREYGWMQDNPVNRIRRKPLRNERVRFLDRDELVRLLAMIEESNNPYLKVAVLISISTGGRKSEILGLKWKDVDLESGRITFTSTKNGTSRSVMIVGAVLTALREHANMKGIDSEYIFPSRQPQWKKGEGRYSKPWEDLRAPFERALKSAGIENFRWHDMRHCCASYLLATGATLAEVGKILGHKTAQMTWRYAHLSQNHSDELVEKMTQKFFQLEL